MLTKQKVKFLELGTFLLSLLRWLFVFSPVGCKLRDFEDAVDRVRAVDEPRDRHGGLSLGPLAVAGHPGRRGPEGDENDNGGT